MHDGRGFTAARDGFATGDGDLLQVVEVYDDMRPNNVLSGFVPQLVRVGFVEILRTATGELVAVPSIPAHTAPEYPHATVDGDIVVVAVKKRTLSWTGADEKRHPSRDA